MAADRQPSGDWLPRGITGDNEQHLIERARQGDRSAIEALWVRHVNAAKAFARVHCGVNEPDDIVAEVFAKILALWEDGKGPKTHFRAYLYTAIKNLAINGDVGAHETPADGWDDRLASGDSYQSVADRSALASIFYSMNERYRRALWMSAVEGLSIPELARHMGIKSAHASRVLYLAKKQFRQLWSKQEAAELADFESAATGGVTRGTIDMGAHTARPVRAEHAAAPAAGATSTASDVPGTAGTGDAASTGKRSMPVAGARLVGAICGIAAAGYVSSGIDAEAAITPAPLPDSVLPVAVGGSRSGWLAAAAVALVAVPLVLIVLWSTTLGASSSGTGDIPTGAVSSSPVASAPARSIPAVTQTSEPRNDTPRLEPSATASTPASSVATTEPPTAPAPAVPSSATSATRPAATTPALAVITLHDADTAGGVCFPAFSGTAEPGSTVEVSTPRHGIVGNAVVSADGTWHLPRVGRWSYGTQRVTASYSPGTQSSTAAQATARVTVAPPPSVGVNRLTGQLAVQVRGIPGQSVAVRVDGELLGTVVLDASGAARQVFPWTGTTTPARLTVSYQTSVCEGPALGLTITS